jgi:hypothetical protein
MVLWKLAGMVCLDPERESDGREKRWCWGEVMRQLLYRLDFVRGFIALLRLLDTPQIRT